MALHRLCVRAVRAGRTALLEHLIAARAVPAVLHLVYSPSTEVSAYAMAILGVLSGSGTASDAKRAVFRAGVMFPVISLGPPRP